MKAHSKPQGPDPELTVGQIAARSGVAVSTIHFYESKGLIQSWRNKSNHRRYARAMLRRVALIQVAQRTGISLHPRSMEVAAEGALGNCAGLAAAFGALET